MKSRCNRSLRKSEEPHYLSVIFTENDGRAAVSKAHCSCKGGSGGHFNHIFALIFQLNDYSCLNVKEIPSDATCTSLPQSWHIPRATSTFPYLGASPDGKVFDPSTHSKYGLLEIKCPFSKRGETLEQAASDPNFFS